MARRKFNREVLTTALSACLNFGNFTVGATGAVGTIYQAKSNSVRSVTRNSAGNYTFQFNEPYPLALAYIDLELHRAAVTDAKVDVDYDAATYSNTTGQLTVFCSSGGTQGGVAATGTITAVANASMADTDYITIGDGFNPPVVYEYDKAADGVTAGRVNWAAGASTANDVATTLVTAINANQPLLTCSAPSAGVFTITHKILGTVGNVTITENVANAGFLVTGLSGGSANQAAADPATGAELHWFFVELRQPGMNV